MAQTARPEAAAAEPERRGMAVAVDMQPRSFAELAEQRAGGGSRLLVRFLRRWQVYFAGDCAVFPHRMAERLVREGFAERVNGNAEGPAPAGAIMATRYPVPVEARARRERPGE